MERSIYEIADSLEMGLKYSNGVLTGTSIPRKVRVSGVDVIVKANIVKHFHHGGQFGVVVNLIGALNIMVVRYKPSSVLSAYLIDGSMVNISAISENEMSLQDVIALLRSGITASFFKRPMHDWAPLTLPKD
jgi:hypothetical protein